MHMVYNFKAFDRDLPFLLPQSQRGEVSEMEREAEIVAGYWPMLNARREEPWDIQLLVATRRIHDLRQRAKLNPSRGPKSKGLSLKSQMERRHLTQEVAPEADGPQTAIHRTGSGFARQILGGTLPLLFLYFSIFGQHA